MSFLPERYNFSIWKGATFRVSMTLYTDAGVTPRNLTGHSAEMVIRDAPEGTALITLSTQNGRITLGGSTGTIELLINATDTASISWTTGVYDLTVTAGSGGDTDALLFGGVSVQGI